MAACIDQSDELAVIVQPHHANVPRIDEAFAPATPRWRPVASFHVWTSKGVRLRAPDAAREARRGSSDIKGENT